MLQSCKLMMGGGNCDVDLSSTHVTISEAPECKVDVATDVQIGYNLTLCMLLSVDPQGLTPIVFKVDDIKV